MKKQLVGILLSLSFLIGMLPFPSAEASTKDECYEQVREARMPRPSSAIDSSGKEVKLDNSARPHPENEVYACVNGALLVTDVPIAEEQGSTLIPMRALLEALKADIQWDTKTNTVTAKLEDQTIRLQVDNPVATINGQELAMQVPARMIQNRVLVPLRFVSEQLNSSVVWQPGKRIIHIYSYPELRVKALSGISSNETDDYSYNNYFSTSSRYLFNSNGIMTMAEEKLNDLHIQQFNSDFLKIKDFSVPFELSNLGGVHAGEDGNYYAIFGDGNLEESSAKSVYRIVKYDKNWTKLDQLDIKDVYVTIPFRSSNLSMDSYQGKLVVYSARQRYLTPDDGLHHQSNIVFQVDMKTMKLLYAEGMWPRNHVSHSFANYVRFDGNKIVYADHGDAYPRSIVVQVEENGQMLSKTDVLKFPGKIGDNYTGARLGGLEVARDNYLVVGSSVSLTERYGQSKAQNLFLGVLPKSSKSAEVQWLTNHSVRSEVEIIETHIVKITDNKFVLMWTEIDRNTNKEVMSYMVVDGTGKELRKATKLVGIASPGNLTPLVKGNTISWYYFNSTNLDPEKKDGIELYELTIE
ncbi:copper amine oxidase N-terminal domain-containing protein [Paenibacillus albiflavus]|uniref:copper amine oxidase N-terminal domain-containing protein n=1 Tax=Paenibacillus albiflavus TaxID=2545760 RepID=UPI0014042FA6|nr:copper amine oxidase N-terminal domain-containing protein [Paenibacillus albiflavus]